LRNNSILINFGKMSTKHKILVSEKSKNFLISREAVELLFNQLNSLSDVEIDLDFSNVDFVSRSYADHFYKAKIDFELKNNVKIQILNANERVITMFHVVSLTQSSINRQFEKPKRFKFSKMEILNDYMLSI